MYIYNSYFYVQNNIFDWVLTKHTVADDCEATDNEILALRCQGGKKGRGKTDDTINELQIMWKRDNVGE